MRAYDDDREISPSAVDQRLTDALRVAAQAHASDLAGNPYELGKTLAELKSLAHTPGLSSQEQDILRTLQTEISALISGLPHG